jgi:hypothetical protein
VSVRAFDQAGNQSPAAVSDGVTVDSTPPTAGRGRTSTPSRPARRSRPTGPGSSTRSVGSPRTGGPSGRRPAGPTCSRSPTSAWRPTPPTPA